MKGRMQGALMRSGPVRRMRADGPLMTELRIWLISRGSTGADIQEVKARFSREHTGAVVLMQQAERLGVAVSHGEGLERRWRVRTNEQQGDES